MPYALFDYVGGSFHTMGRSPAYRPNPKPFIPIRNCPRDTKRCSDGSYVTRTGPLCQFPPCPPMKGPAPVPTPKPPTQRACPLDWKPCPGGGGVGRTGPLCQFPPCPPMKVPAPKPTPKPPAKPVAVSLNCMPGPGKRNPLCSNCGKTVGNITYRCVY
jgi:hypothetical protein